MKVTLLLQTTRHPDVHMVDDDNADETVPAWTQQVEAEVKKLAGKFRYLAVVMTVQRAMGAMYQGDMDGARDALHGLSDDDLKTVSVTAAALGSIADELIETHR